MKVALRTLRLLLPAVLVVSGTGPLAGQMARSDDPINLDPVAVDARRDLDGYDETGMGAQEAELADSPRPWRKPRPWVISTLS
jgi:hypothetical protein